MTTGSIDAAQRLGEHWPAPAADALARALARAGDGSIVALDFDNTCVIGDFGELLHAALSEDLAYALADDRFWHTIDPRDGRDRIRAAWRAERDEPAHAALVADLIAVYLRRLRRAGVADAYGWATTLHAGMSVERLGALALRVFEAALAEAQDERTLTAPDGVVVSRPTGLRVRPALRCLVDEATRGGLMPWIVTATNQWSVAAVSRHVGVPADRVVGNLCVVRDGIIEAERDGPTTWRAGKVEAIDARIGRRPAVAVGDTWTDVEMLGAAEHLAVLIDRGDAALRELAEERDWLVVPASALDQVGST